MVQNIYRLTAAIFLALNLAACSYTPFGNDNHLTGSPVGTAIGAGIGGGIGYVAGGNSVGYGLLGGLLGGSVGYYVTTLRFDSGGVIQSGGVVYTLGDYVGIEVPTDKLFDANSDEFLYEADPILDSIVAVLNRYPNNNVLISGNTSGFGTRKWELKLSEARARQVASYLWAHGITPFKSQSIDMRKLSYVGYGNFFPISNNIKAHSIRENSRIQITSYPCNVDICRNKKCSVFRNIGAADEEPVPPNHPVANIDDEFRGDKLPEQVGTRKNDFKDAFNEPSSTTAPASANVKGDGWSNQNSIAKGFQEPAAPSSSYKGERGYKGE